MHCHLIIYCHIYMYNILLIISAEVAEKLLIETLRIKVNLNSNAFYKTFQGMRSVCISHSYPLKLDIRGYFYKFHTNCRLFFQILCSMNKVPVYLLNCLHQ